MSGDGLRRRSLLGAALAVLAPAHARAAGQIALLVGASVGSPTDIAARAFVPFLERHLPGTDIGITNLPGDHNMKAWRTLAEANGGTSLFGWVNAPALPARMVEHATDELAHLRLLGTVMKEPIAIVSPASSPLTSVADIVARSADSTQDIPLGTPPAGTPSHLTALRLQAVSGTRLNIVPFPSAAAVRQAVIAGNVAAAALGLTDVLEPLRDDRLSGLAVSTAHRANAFPDIPALREAGLPLTAAIQWGLAVPAAMQADAFAPVAAALQAIAADPEFTAEGDATGFTAHWLDGTAWTVEMRAQQAELAGLWRADPWS